MSIVQVTISKVNNGFVIQYVDDSNLQTTDVIEGKDVNKIMNSLGTIILRMSGKNKAAVKEDDDGEEQDV